MRPSNAASPIQFALSATRSTQGDRSHCCARGLGTVSSSPLVWAVPSSACTTRKFPRRRTLNAFLCHCFVLRYRESGGCRRHRWSTALGYLDLSSLPPARSTGWCATTRCPRLPAAPSADNALRPVDHRGKPGGRRPITNTVGCVAQRAAGTQRCCGGGPAVGTSGSSSAGGSGSRHSSARVGRLPCR
jgi:hypothetical protein